MLGKDSNIDSKVVDGFGREWSRFGYLSQEYSEFLETQFKAYTSTVKFSEFNPKKSIAADFGAGSGRWTEKLLPYFKKIYALEPSDGAVRILNYKFNDNSKVEILQESVGLNSIKTCSLDFAMSLGVLHHIPDTRLALQDISLKMKSGGVLLCYLYYDLSEKPFLYRKLHNVSNLIRLFVSRSPYFVRITFARIIAFLVYLPLSRFARLYGYFAKDNSNLPLHHYANMPFSILENDALDRFGTRLEQRFSKEEICTMLVDSGFNISTLSFSVVEPFWTFSVRKL